VRKFKNHPPRGFKSNRKRRSVSGALTTEPKLQQDGYKTRRPDFIVLGAAKCGTSTVCAYFEDHPEVFMVPNCDPNFFSRDEHFARGTEWYEALFQPSNGQKLCGEGSCDYAWGERYPETVARMAAYDPGLKLIYMVRHPIDRIVSGWIQNRSDSGDGVPATLDRCVIEQPDEYIDQSLYWKNLSRYRARFPDEQIFIGFLTDLSRDPEAFFLALTKFLGTEPAPMVKRKHLNPSAGKVVPSLLYSAVKRLPLTNVVKEMMPPTLRDTLKRRLFDRRIDDRPQFSPRMRRYVIDAVREDAEKLLEHCGKPHGFWSFD
jgi:hypothetical protein